MFDILICCTERRRIWSSRGALTCIKIEFDSGIFFSFGGVVMRSTSDTVAINTSRLAFCQPRGKRRESSPIASTYTWTLVKSTLDVTSVAGCNRTDKAANPATKAATVVKKPNTPCTRLVVECMVDLSQSSNPISIFKHALGRRTRF